MYMHILYHSLPPSLTYAYAHVHTHNHSRTHTIIHAHVYRRALFNSIIYGMTYAFSQSTIYLLYAVIFRFGAYQVIQDYDHIAYTDFDDIFIVFTALVFGAISAGETGAFAPNYAKAKLSANRIFFLLDREPLIDGYSKEGSKLVSLIYIFIYGNVNAQ